MNPILTPEALRLLRLRAQLLVPRSAGPLASPAEVLRAVCGVQAQDLSAALLAVRVRSVRADCRQRRPGSHGASSAACLVHARHTAPVTPPQDARWLIPLLGPALIAGDRRRMAQLGWDEQSARARH